MSAAILVVDDEQDIEPLFRQQFRRELRQGAFIMEFALSAAEALKRIEAVGVSEVVLIFSDINMPGMNGLDLLERLKTDRPELTVVMVTAYGDDDTRRAAADRGADGLLTKPVDFALLRAEIVARMAERGGGA
jgi:CheY-like chemotaxis protein